MEFIVHSYYFSKIVVMSTRKGSASTKSNDRPTKKQRTNESTRGITSSNPSEKWRSSLVITQLEKALSKKGNAADASQMKKYMRDKFEFYGVKSPARRKISNDILKGKDNNISSKDLRDFAGNLWEKAQRELQYISMEFLEKHRKALCQNEADFEENMEFFRMLLTTKSWWDTVDMMAYKLVGYLVQTHPTKGKPVMEVWVSSENMWLRRTAILHQLCCKENFDEEMLFEFCLARCHEEEFFIRKAIGWALRDYARTKPDNVKKFLKKHKDSLSKLSYNEAAKHLNIAKK